MKTEAIQRLRSKCRAYETVYGLWITLESPSITEIAVAMGLDWVVIDAEHGHLDWKDIVEHLRATVRSNTVALVRVAELNAGLIKRALDIGADGVVVPWIETAQQLKQAIRFSRYPLEGVRGIGAEQNRLPRDGDGMLNAFRRQGNLLDLLHGVVGASNLGQSPEDAARGGLGRAPRRRDRSLVGDARGPTLSVARAQGRAGCDRPRRHSYVVIR